MRRGAVLGAELKKENRFSIKRGLIVLQGLGWRSSTDNQDFFKTRSLRDQLFYKMITPFTLHALLVLLFVVDLSRPVCVDVLSNTEAVLGRPMKLTCIFCMKREEVPSKTRVDWFFLARDHDNTTTRTPILQYVNGAAREVPGPWEGRLKWAGSTDLQDLSIHIRNVTWYDSGTYQCQVFRQFEFDFFSPSINKTRTIDLTVIETASDDTTAVYSEIMMYVLLVFLTCWLLLEMVYCYRKISKSDEQTQETAY